MNRTFLVGRLTADPELRTTPTGIATTRITVAVNRMPNANGERIADFINVVVWRRQAENVSKYCTKGSLVGVEGRIQSRSYDAQDGTRRYVTEVIADNVTFLGSKSSAGASMNYQTESMPSNEVPTSSGFPQDDVAFPTGEDFNMPTADVSEEDPFKDFGSEVVLSDDDLPF
jgi:single-strand DNA-binding protein